MGMGNQTVWAAEIQGFRVEVVQLPSGLYVQAGDPASLHPLYEPETLEAIARVFLSAAEILKQERKGKR